MNFLVALVGWALVATGLLGIAQPHLMLSWVSWLARGCSVYVTVGTRVLLGLLFIFSAPKCRLPRFISTVGIIALWLPARFISFLAAAALTRSFNGCSASPACCIQLLYAVTILFGAALIYSGSRRRSKGER